MSSAYETGNYPPPGDCECILASEEAYSFETNTQRPRREGMDLQTHSQTRYNEADKTLLIASGRAV